MIFQGRVIGKYEREVDLLWFYVKVIQL
jgi:hypothetical protein